VPVSHPEEFGGLGLSPLELCVVARRSPRRRAGAVRHIGRAGDRALKLAGSDAQKKKWLPLLASGEAIGTLATPKAAAAQPRNIRTTFAADASTARRFRWPMASCDLCGGPANTVGRAIAPSRWCWST